jgi:hypothetical protein
MIMSEVTFNVHLAIRLVWRMGRLQVSQTLKFCAHPVVDMDFNRGKRPLHSTQLSGTMGTLSNEKGNNVQNVKNCTWPMRHSQIKQMLFLSQIFLARISNANMAENFGASVFVPSKHHSEHPAI